MIPYPELERMRSEFNHDWLKNQAIVKLLAAEAVLSGSVQNTSVWELLDEVRSDWPAWREKAAAILAYYAAAPSAAMLAKTGLPGAGPELAEWYKDVLELRLRRAAMPDLGVNNAKLAVLDLDGRIAAIATLAHSKGGANMDAEVVHAVVNARQSAQVVSNAFSALRYACS